MTNSELNRDIKRLARKLVKASKELEGNNYYDCLENEIKPEFKRLYYADDKMQALSANSIRLMLRMHLTLRALPLHTFGININLEKLI